MDNNTPNPRRWFENVDVFLNPNVPMQITYYTSSGALVTTTVIFKDVFEVEGSTFLVMANGVLIPLENLVMVHVPDTEGYRQQAAIDDDISRFQLLN